MIIILLLLCARFDHSIASGYRDNWDDYSTLPCISCICDDCVSQHITRGSSKRERAATGRLTKHTTSLARLLACPRQQQQYLLLQQQREYSAFSGAD